MFAALGLPAVTRAAAATERWAQGQPVFMPLEALHPSLADLLKLRAVLGLRNPGHTLAKLLPALPGALRVVNHTHPEYALSLSEFLSLNGATALLLRGIGREGERVDDGAKARLRDRRVRDVRGVLGDAGRSGGSRSPTA